MKKKTLWISFALGMIATLTFPGLFPGINFLTFAPFFVFCILYCRLPTVLWISFCCGLIIDLLSSTKMGLYVINYCFTSFLLYRQRRNFIEEKSINLPVFTGLYSLVATVLQLFIRFIFDRNAQIIEKGHLFDLITMPFLDALYAYVWFYMPLLIWKLSEKQFKLWIAKKNEQS